MITYWVCPKGKRGKYGKIVDNFKSMMHYYFLYSDGDDKAEIYLSGSRNDVNMADKFLKIFNKYHDMREELKNDCINKLAIPFEID